MLELSGNHFSEPSSVVFRQIGYGDTMKPNLMFLVKEGILPGHGIEVQIGRDRRVVVDIACRARQAIEKGQDKSTDAVKFQ